MNYSPEPTCPMNSVSWYDATAYCNWLSKKDGIPEDEWCYGPNEKGDYAEGMKLMSNPESERAIACRPKRSGSTHAVQEQWRRFPSAKPGSYWRNTGGIARTRQTEHSLSAV